MSDDASIVVVDIGAQEFNSRFAQCLVLQYYRNGELHSIYKRITPIPTDFNAYRKFTNEWISSPSNLLNIDFAIYSSLSDLKANVSQWQWCNYDGNGVGYPRDCGPTGVQPHEWFHMPGGGFTMPGITAGAEFRFFEDCPIGKIITNFPTAVFPTIFPLASETPTQEPSTQGNPIALR